MPINQVELLNVCCAQLSAFPKLESDLRWRLGGLPPRHLRQAQCFHCNRDSISSLTMSTHLIYFSHVFKAVLTTQTKESEKEKTEKPKVGKVNFKNVKTWNLAGGVGPCLCIYIVTGLEFLSP